MRNLYRIRLAYVFIFICISPFLFSQVDDTPPDPNTPMIHFSETGYAKMHDFRTKDPVITAMVEAINADTLRKTLRQLQDWGSRCLLNDNHKDVAVWFMNKFLSYGYTDVKLDSFHLIVNWNNLYYDTSWQYNVVCRLAGSSAPEETYIIGGHYDSFSFGDPYNNAPGVDDNGTSVAATLEIARVMAETDYMPEASIEFTLFAAEELGLFGSRYASGKARIDGKDIRYMFNIDMIAHNPDNLTDIIVYKYLGFEWACYEAARAIEQYTGLSVLIPDVDVNRGSDSYPYWLESYPSVFYQEITFNPYIHTFADTLGNCNIPYFTEATAGALATLAELQRLPYPQELKARSTKEDITLQWKPTNNAFVKGFNIYRSDLPGGPYEKITAEPFHGARFHDLASGPNRQYYYVVTTVNNSDEESGYSNEATGSRFRFSDTLLVLANQKQSQITPDSIYEFYRAILDTIPFVWQDVNSEQRISLALFSRYRYILWLSNTMDFDVPVSERDQCTEEFINNGGNLLYAGFSPSRFWMNIKKFPEEIPEDSFYHHLFRIDSADRKIPCMLFRANAVSPGFDTLNVDSLKYMDEDFPGQIFNVEVFTPSEEGRIIYRFDSKYDSNSIYGKMKQKPVGMEYMGPDFKSILLSFPLYYMDTSDAADFLNYVMSEKFTHPVGIKPINKSEPFAVNVYPNPARKAFNVAFTLDRPDRVKMTLTSLQGQTLATLLEGSFEKGTHCVQFDLQNLAPGMYYLIIKSNEGIAGIKIVRI